MTAKEFVRLRLSEDSADYLRAAHNKTVPIEVLAILARDPDARVRRWVATKNKLSPEFMMALAADEKQRSPAGHRGSQEGPG